MANIPTKDAIKVKEFVASLPEEKRKQFQSNWDSTDDAGRQVAVANIMKQVSSDKVQEGEDMKSALVGVLAPLGIGAAGIALAKKGLDVAFKPSNEKKALIKHELEPIKQQYNVDKNIAPEKVPAEMSYKLNETLRNANSETGAIRATSDNLAKNFKTWRNNGFDTYIKRLQGIDDAMHTNGLGVPLNAGTFSTEVLEKTAAQLDGLALPKEASAVRSQIKLFNSSDPVQFSKAKQVITNLTKTHSNIGRALTENFVDYLANDKVAQATPAGAMFKAVQADYIPFVEADKLVKPLLKNGVLNTKLITNEINAHIKGSGNPNLNKLLKVIATDSPMATGMPNLAANVAEIENLSAKVSGFKGAVGKAGSIARQVAGLNEKIGNRVKLGAAALGVGGATALAQFLKMGMGGKVAAALPVLGAVGQAQTAFDVFRLQKEPLQQFQKAMQGATFGLAGKPVPPMERTNQINQELQQDPNAYKNSIMTPETYNYLKMRDGIIKEVKSKGNWSRSKKEKAIAMLEEAL